MELTVCPRHDLDNLGSTVYNMREPNAIKLLMSKTISKSHYRFYVKLTFPLEMYGI